MICLWQISDGGLYIPRLAYRYDVDTDRWATIASLPQAIQGGGQQAVALDDRHLLLMGTSHDDSFRIGKSLWHRQQERAKYYGDVIFCYDRVTDTYSRVGKLLYGVGTSSWVAVENGSRILSFGGEPMHGFKDNSETVVQIGTVRRLLD